MQSRRFVLFSTTVARGLRAALLIVVGLAVTIGSASSDAYLHRGTSQDNSIIYRQPTGRALATNVDLRGMSDTALQSSINYLSSGGYGFVRQEFSWTQFESAPGQFDWTEYRRIVDALSAANIVVVVVLVDSPIWARAPDAVAFRDAPPLNVQVYEQMCAALRAEFPDLHLFQIGQNLDDPEFWGGKSLQALTYRQLLSAAARGLDIAATDSTLISGEVSMNPDIRKTGGDIDVIERLLRDPDIRGLIRVVGVSADGGNESPVPPQHGGRPDEPVPCSPYPGSDRQHRGDRHADLVHPRRLDRQRGQPGISRRSGAIRGIRISTGALRMAMGGPHLQLDARVEPDVPNSANLALIVNGNPTPLYSAMSGFAKSSFGASITNGFVPANASACDYSGNWQDQHLTEGIYRTVRDPNSR